jgi:divalent metal cation (Fe/Co/Zn/Cd) transporter
MGILIIVTGIRIIRKSVAGVMDEVDNTMIEQMVSQLEELRKVEWIDVHNLRTIKYGQTIHVDCHLTLPWYWTIARGHEEIHEIEAMMNERFPKSYEFFIHVDSCLPAMCPACEISCDHRKAPFEERIEWTPAKLVQSQRLKT